MALMLTSLLAGHYSFRTTRHEITADLNQALASLIEKESKAPFVISQDTIRAYRQLRKVSEGPVMIAISDKRFSRFLKNKALREKAFITFDLVDENTPAPVADRPLVCSDTLFIRAADSQDVLALRGYVQLSAATIFGLSDQRYPALLIILALLWLAGTEYMIRKRKALLAWEASIIRRTKTASILLRTTPSASPPCSNSSCCFSGKPLHIPFPKKTSVRHSGLKKKMPTTRSIPSSSGSNRFWRHIQT